MHRLVALTMSALVLTGCSMPGFPTKSTPPQTPVVVTAETLPQAPEGTCFAVVYKNAEGSYDFATGVGNGTAQPQAVFQRKLSARRVDQAVAKERAVQKIDPGCLTSSILNRADADPKSLETVPLNETYTPPPITPVKVAPKKVAPPPVKVEPASEPATEVDHPVPSLSVLPAAPLAVPPSTEPAPMTPATAPSAEPTTTETPAPAAPAN